MRLIPAGQRVQTRMCACGSPLLTRDDEGFSQSRLPGVSGGIATAMRNPRWGVLRQRPLAFGSMTKILRAQINRLPVRRSVRRAMPGLLVAVQIVSRPHAFGGHDGFQRGQPVPVVGRPIRSGFFCKPATGAVLCSGCVYSGSVATMGTTLPPTSANSALNGSVASCCTCVERSIAGRGRPTVRFRAQSGNTGV